MLAIWDYLVLAAIALLVFFTPFAFGAVDAWALGIAEVICFSLTILWLAKSYHVSARHGFSNFAWRDVYPLASPVVLLLGFVLFQLLPLPPPVLRQLSPQAYRLYEKSLPGWPKRIVYTDPRFERSLASRKPATAIAILPTMDEVKSGASVPFAPKIVQPPADANAGGSGLSALKR